MLTGYKGMLETSLTVMMFSLLPLTLEFIVLDFSEGMALLSTIFALWHLFIFVIALRRTNFIWGGAPIVVIKVLSTLVILAQIIVGLRGLSNHLIAAYLLGLFWLLLMSSLTFWVLIYSSLEIDDEAFPTGEWRPIEPTPTRGCPLTKLLVLLNGSSSHGTADLLTFCW